MKNICLIAILTTIAGCSGEQVEEFAFRKTMEYQLKEQCGESDPQCITAIEEQIVYCMKQSEWRRYLENDEDEQEFQRFIGEFFPCFKDSDGKPYFAPK